MGNFGKGAKFLSATALVIAPAASGVAQENQDTRQALAQLMTDDGVPAGTVEVTAAPDGVLVEVLLSGLTPGEHALHLHEVGSCSPDFGAAGDHFAPDGNAHGFLNPDGPHGGDLPNVFVSVEGTATAHFYNNRVMLDEGDASLMDEDGTAVIVHELPDLYGEEAGAGGRVACGVLEHRL